MLVFFFLVDLVNTTTKMETDCTIIIVAYTMALLSVALATIITARIVVKNNTAYKKNAR